MTKYLQVEMPNGERWLVPLHIIADDRAKYFAKKDPDTTYEEEYEYALSEEYEIFDWAANNMNWKEVKEYAKEGGRDQLTERGYQEGWCNGEKEIVELEE